MEKEIEDQLMKILSKVSLAERTRNRTLDRQTSRLFRTLLYMKVAAGSKNTKQS
jgi:hypothetical protein